MATPYQREHQSVAGVVTERNDLSVYIAEDLRAVEEELNNRPRKALGWRSPAQVLDIHTQAAST